MALFPLTSNFEEDFVLQLLPVDTDHTMDEVAAAAAHHSVGRRVADRPGHDRRYAIDARRIATELGWRPAVGFAEGLATTVDWYLANPDWVADVTSGAYRDWIARQYG